MPLDQVDLILNLYYAGQFLIHNNIVRCSPAKFMNDEDYNLNGETSMKVHHGTLCFESSQPRPVKEGLREFHSPTVAAYPASQ
jgi:hypothetical protein